MTTKNSPASCRTSQQKHAFPWQLVRPWHPAGLQHWQPMERETGIEPALVAWKATVLPLNYSRFFRDPGDRSGDSSVSTVRFETGGGRWIAPGILPPPLRGQPFGLFKSAPADLSNRLPDGGSNPPLATASHSCTWWREVDSNHRRRKPADLQSAPVGRLGIPPTIVHAPSSAIAAAVQRPRAIANAFPRSEPRIVLSRRRQCQGFVHMKMRRGPSLVRPAHRPDPETG